MMKTEISHAPSVALLTLALATSCGPRKSHNPQGEIDRTFLDVQNHLDLAYLSKPCPAPGLYTTTAPLLSGMVIADWWGNPIVIYVGCGGDSDESIDVIYFSGADDGEVWEAKDYVHRAQLICMHP